MTRLGWDRTAWGGDVQVHHRRLAIECHVHHLDVSSPPERPGQSQARSCASVGGGVDDKVPGSSSAPRDRVPGSPSGRRPTARTTGKPISCKVLRGCWGGGSATKCQVHHRRLVTECQVHHRRLVIECQVHCGCAEVRRSIGSNEDCTGSQREEGMSESRSESRSKRGR